MTDKTGTTIEEESDFYPFGGERIIADALANQNYKFLGKERDTESGLDYFGARYYGNVFGRFTSADSFSKDSELADPQRWNLYSYVRNNPLKYVDEFGEELKFASPELEAVVTETRGQSPTFDQALKGFEGLGAPDLTFTFGEAGKDANGVDDATGKPKPASLTGNQFLLVHRRLIVSRKNDQRSSYKLQSLSMIQSKRTMIRRQTLLSMKLDIDRKSVV